MAVLSITEFEQLGVTLVESQLIAAPKMPGVVEQSIGIGGGSTPSAAFNAKTRFVRVNCDIACCLAWSNPGDPDPTAVVGFHRLGPNETDYAGVLPGGKLAVIASPT